LLFSPDGTTLIGRPQNQSGLSKLQFWQTRTWQQRTRTLGRQAAFSQGGRLVAVVGGTDGDGVDLWRLSSPLAE
jgi:hypothetical protein